MSEFFREEKNLIFSSSISKKRKISDPPNWFHCIPQNMGRNWVVMVGSLLLVTNDILRGTKSG